MNVKEKLGLELAIVFMEQNGYSDKQLRNYIKQQTNHYILSSYDDTKHFPEHIETPQRQCRNCNTYMNYKNQDRNWSCPACTTKKPAKTNKNKTK